MKEVLRYSLRNKAGFFLLILSIVISTLMFLASNFANIRVMNGLFSLSLQDTLLALLISFLIFIAYICVDYISERIKNNYIKNLNLEYRKDLSAKMIELDYPSFKKNDKSHYISELNNDAKQVEDKSFAPFVNLIDNVVKVLAAFISLTYFHYFLTLTTVVMFLIVYFVPKFTNRNYQAKAENLSEANSKYTHSLRGLIFGYEIWDSSNKKLTFKEAIDKASVTLENSKKSFSDYVAAVQAIISSVSVSTQFLTNLVFIILAVKGFVTPGAILAVGNFTGTFFNGISSIKNYQVSIDSSKSLFEKVKSIQNPVDNKYALATLSSFDDGIAFENVSFRYDEASDYILKNKNLKFKKDRKYALLAASGSGKSTILKLIAKRLKNYEGKITFDGKDYREIKDEAVKEKIAYIDQETYIFDESILYNITLGAEYDPQKLKEIIRQSGLDAVVKNESDLDKRCGENGLNLSGGQRQLIAIARAFFQDKKIILFDEGTSSLDKEKSDYIEDTLLKKEGITLIYVSHQLSAEQTARFDQCIKLQ